MPPSRCRGREQWRVFVILKAHIPFTCCSCYNVKPPCRASRVSWGPLLGVKTVMDFALIPRSMEKMASIRNLKFYQKMLN